MLKLNRETIRIANFLAKIKIIDNGCWEWQGAKFPFGYGAFSFGDNFIGRAHRYSYNLFIGEIPNDKPYLDHLCYNPSCVNPKHLEPVTALENVLREHNLDRLAIYNLSKTHCPKGYKYDEANTYHIKSGVECAGNVID